MSLINEALKRAREAQSQAPGGQPGQAAPAPGRRIELRPAEPPPSAATNHPSVMPIVLTIAAVVGVLLLWQARSQHADGGTTMAVAAKSNPAPQPAPQAANRTPVTERVIQPPALETKRATESATARPASNVGPVNAAAPSQTEPAGTAVAGSGTQTASAPLIAAAEPASAPALRLQAILFTPRNPSAMINGKMVYAGDKLGQLRVVAIGRDYATLTGPAGTNVLTLPE